MLSILHCDLRKFAFRMSSDFYWDTVAIETVLPLHRNTDEDRYLQKLFVSVHVAVTVFSCFLSTLPVCL